MLSLALDPGRSGFRPTVIRVRITKSAIARNDQRDALFQRPHAAIVPDVLPDVFYRAPGTLVGSARRTSNRMAAAIVTTMSMNCMGHLPSVSWRSTSDPKPCRR